MANGWNPQITVRFFLSIPQEVIAEIPLTTAEETDQAIEATYRARGVMATMPAHQRTSILERLFQ